MQNSMANSMAHTSDIEHSVSAQESRDYLRSVITESVTNDVSGFEL